MCYKSNGADNKPIGKICFGKMGHYNVATKAKNKASNNNGDKAITPKIPKNFTKYFIVFSEKDKFGST